MPGRDVKDLNKAFWLCLLLGWSGAHHFYLRRHLFGTLYLLTFGFLGFGWLYDLNRIGSLQSDSQTRLGGVLRHDDMRLLTLFLGFTGLQHFLLGRNTAGVYYLLTFGGLGFGWITDIFRIHMLTENYNLSLGRAKTVTETSIVLSDAYVYCIPFGFLGLHQFYLSRPRWGLFYLVTFGNFGLGPLLDVFRMRRLIVRRDTWLLSDAFLLWLPLGLFGAHWLYLQQRCRAFSYAATLGYLGIGWLVDAYRIPVHVRSLNRKLMLASLIHADDVDSLQWDDSDFRSALLPDSTTKLSMMGSSKKVHHLARLNSPRHGVCLECERAAVCLVPCSHFSLCAECVAGEGVCPRCGARITGWATVDI